MKERIRTKCIPILLIFCLLLTLLPPNAAHAILLDTTDQSFVAPEISSPLQLDDDCQLLSYVERSQFEHANHVARLKDEETLSNYVFLNADGTKTVYYMPEAVKFRDSDGNVREKDIMLTSALNGYVTQQNSVQMHLPTSASSGCV